VTQRPGVTKTALALVHRVDPLTRSRCDDLDEETALRVITERIDALETGRHRGHRRIAPRVLAGSTLGLAGVGVAIVLALGGSTASPAFAITRSNDGSVLVHLNNVEAVPAAEHELAAMGLNEWFEAGLVAGTASGNGTVICTIPTAAQAASESDATHRTSSGVAAGGPTVKVLLGTNGTQTLPAGQAGPTQPNGGPMHLGNCYLYSGTFPRDGNTGNTGAG
jgi:hypothetical protein